MKNHPFFETARSAQIEILKGYDVYQKFEYEMCLTEQHIDKVNHFHTSGKCEKCDHVTDLIKTGCNYLLFMSFPKGVDVEKIFDAINDINNCSDHNKDRFI